jgi:hypothetical protein
MRTFDKETLFQAINPMNSANVLGVLPRYCGIEIRSRERTETP